MLSVVKGFILLIRVSAWKLGYKRVMSNASDKLTFYLIQDGLASFVTIVFGSVLLFFITHSVPMMN